MQKAIISLLRDFLNKKSEAEGYEKSLKDAREDVRRLKQLNNKNSTSSRINRVTPKLPILGMEWGISLPNSPTVLAADSRCSHRVEVGDISAIKCCLNCKEKYREKFIVSIPNCKNTNEFLKMLLTGDDVANGIALHS